MKVVIKDPGANPDVIELEVIKAANAAVGIAQRSGMGRVRHSETNQLWLYENDAEGNVNTTKIGTSDNTADQRVNT